MSYKSIDIITCDRCKKRHEGARGGVAKGWLHANLNYTYGKDLCPKCAKAFRAWLKPGAKKK